MRLLSGDLVLSPSDLVGFSLCRHLTALELAVARGELPPASAPDPELDLFARRGRDHERSILGTLKGEGRQVAEVMVVEEGRAGLERAAALTLDAMRSGADVIYQATFFDGRWAGRADFLWRRDDRPSGLGAYSYEPADAKLSRQIKPAVLLQLCGYAEQLSVLQGVEPEHLHAVLGQGATVSVPHASVAAFYRTVRRGFEAALSAGLRATYPDRVDHCSVCRWSTVCDERRRADDRLTLVADLRRDQESRLCAAGIETVEALASRRATSVKGIGTATLGRLGAQARLQVEQRRTGRLAWELLPVETGRGLCALPAPSPGDLFFDMESDPFVAGGLEYLFGMVELSAAESVYRAFWAHDPAAEKQAFESFVDLVIARLAEHPDLHVYHYGAYEPAALKRLMGVHGTRERELDTILRGQVLVDLHRVVRHGVRVSQESYSIKMLEPLYREARTTAVAGGLGSIVAYEEWRETGDGQRLHEIEAYNQDDCRSLVGLRGWLEARRAEVEAAEGPLSRPVAVDPAPPAGVQASEAAEDEVTAALLAGADGEDAQQLLAHLVGWHRREAKPEWWMWFHRRRLAPEELYDDAEAISGLEYHGVAGKGNRSLTHEYRFDAQQEHRIGTGDRPDDPATGQGAGEVVFVDNVRGVVRLKRSAYSDKAHPLALIPTGPIETSAQRDALLRIGRWVAAHGIDAPGPYRAVRDLLLRRRPRLHAGGSGPLVGSGEDPGAAAVRLAVSLDHACLAVQGPPGSGKTHTGARLVLELVRAGRRVGVTANSHKAITNLLDLLCASAERAGVRLEVLQKASEDGRCAHPMVRQAANNAEVEASLRAGTVHVVAGTAWLFGRQALEGAFDTLVVEEAGQLSLANVVAMGGAARNVVMLGDPRQLSQPSKASHPPGAERSALEHLLGDHETIPADLGVFLSTTRRLHPHLGRFISGAFYGGRLLSHESCARQVLGGRAPLAGAGLRWVPVEHGGNRTASGEEVEAVVALANDLLGRPWTEATGHIRKLDLADLLVVAPYNAQVARLAAALPSGARVGTVDKFQGQQAPVVVYSMAASSAEDVPRGLEFLFSANRLNVALSRAQGLAVLVCSPALLRPACRTVAQVRLANALCRLVELASESDDTAAHLAARLPARRVPA
jgi:predicted RecB family nuclease